MGSPTPNQEWKNRAQSVAATVIASRRIARMEAYSEGNLLARNSRNRGQSRFNSRTRSTVDSMILK